MDKLKNDIGMVEVIFIEFKANKKKKIKNRQLVYTRAMKG